MKDDIFEKESTNKTFFKFAIPSIVGLLIVSLQLMIDGIFVGRYVGPSALDAVNLSRPFLQLITGTAMMITLGGGVISAAHLGSRDNKKANEVTFYTLLAKIVIICGISLVSTIFMDKTIYILGADASLFPLVKSYLLPMTSFAIFYNLIIFTETFVRIGGKPNAIFLSGAIAFVVNVILDYFFIVKLNLGISGAAIATIAGNIFGTLALCPCFFNKKCSIQITKPNGDIALLKKILYNGSSEMITVISTAVATFLFNRIIMNSLGELGVSALTIIFYANGIVNIFLFGLSQALQPIISYNLGANRPNKIYEVIRVALITGAVIGIISFVLMRYYSMPFISLFSKGNNELTLLANTAAGYFSFAYIISFINIIAASFHTAIKKPMESAGIAVLRSLILVSVYLIVMPMIIGETGMWIAIPLAEFTCIFISLFFMKSSYKGIMKNYDAKLQV